MKPTRQLTGGPALRLTGHHTLRLIGSHAPRLTDYRHPVLRLAAATLVITTLSVTTASSARADDAQPTALDLSGFEGEVQLVQADRTRLITPAQGWKLIERRGSLTLAQAEAPAADTLPWVAACGAPKPYVSTRPVGGPGGKGARVEIGITPTTLVRAHRFSGSLRSDVALVGPDVEVGTGTVELARVSGGVLAVRGPGSISAQQATDRVELAVEGAGSLHVKGGITDELTATLQGTGSIRHEGLVQRAVLSASGEGSIRVNRVEDPVRIDQAGFASITTDCAESSCVQ